MSLAAATREAVRNRPVLYDALRAGIVNYTAAADSLALDGDREAIATALRRFADELNEETAAASMSRSITVRLHSSCEPTEVPNTLLAVDGVGVGQSSETGSAGGETAAIDIRDQTALSVTGEVDVALLGSVLDRLRIADIPVAGAGFISEAMVIVVPRRDGPTAVQLVETVADSG